MITSECHYDGGNVLYLFDILYFGQKSLSVIGNVHKYQMHQCNTFDLRSALRTDSCIKLNKV